MSRAVTRGFDAQRMIELRRKEGWSATDLARFAAVDPKSVTSWEAGLTHPNIDKLREVAKALRVPVKTLVRVPPRERQLSDLRVLAALTQPEAAKEAGVSTSYLTQIERGEKRLGDKLALRLAELYRVDPETVGRAYERSRLRPAKAPA